MIRLGGVLIGDRVSDPVDNWRGGDEREHDRGRAGDAGRTVIIVSTSASDIMVAWSE